MDDKRVCFVSLISRDDRPLYIQSFDEPVSPNEFLKYNFLSHMALDIFSSSAIDLRQDTDGVVLLAVQDDVTVYGFESNNGVKIVVGLDNTTTVQRQSVKGLFKAIYRHYVRVVCNPFVQLSDNPKENNTILQNESFDGNIKQTVGQWNNTKANE